MMKATATILVMLLTMPVSYAVLDQVSRRIRLKDRLRT
jgi:multisubunit Na+/H+ antiporter MnhG subunit